LSFFVFLSKRPAFFSKQACSKIQLLLFSDSCSLNVPQGTHTLRFFIRVKQTLPPPPFPAPFCHDTSFPFLLDTHVRWPGYFSNLIHTKNFFAQNFLVRRGYVFPPNSYSVPILFFIYVLQPPCQEILCSGSPTLSEDFFSIRR